ncbi:TPA: hypothetical protein NHV44_005111 [Enterobacter cloacae]|uniref:Uncharacterized protein n=1 Tax=Buttiauxella gaviniae TaxID=82990 RepID=A0ABV3NV64_9ENTR|nr:MULTISPECIES: hypothetical protein [Enterobacteriaceae]HCE8677132.1 hypothetical protein [Enterobacter cloacae]KAA0559046.1 hypothetical protein F0329_03515 [Citrobacter werkmanii]MBD0818978.1 hypothetical protein [Citrobacter sp. C5_2]MDM3155198.1 hypothetical protein [Citrobacter sp. Cf122]UMB84770.1 hypothetical protein I9P40_11735 [Citrobacter portucalensis]
MQKKILFRNKKGIEPADFFIDHFRNIYLSPPVNLEGESLWEIWDGLTRVEKRFIHHLERAYTVWRAASLSWFQDGLISPDEITELQLWVVQEKPDFSLFLERLDTHFATEQKIVEGLNRIHAIFGEPLYLNAFESACYFFLLARHCFTPKNSYAYYNALIKANELYGQFRGWAEIAQSESHRLMRKEQSSQGGKNTVQKSGAALIRNELIRILTEKVENGETFTSKVTLSEALAPALYAFIIENECRIAIKSRVSSAEELSYRIHDWSKRNTPPYDQIYSLAGELIC